ncbi:MAG: 4-amino-4-deoxychorismate lyase [Moorea sp. SIO4G2]|nr:4-amino-4-deoxychorismate lyase [Moorena sp. SIO4G2]
MSKPCFWYNAELIEGNSLSLTIDEPGFIYGATVFTTLRVYDQSLDHPLTHWTNHCHRLQSSLQAFGWQQPDWEQLRQGAQSLITLYPVLRITLFPDGRELIMGRPLPANLAQWQEQGITAWVAQSPSVKFHRCLPTHKTGNYLSPWLAKQMAQNMGAQEGILVDNHGNWLETSTGNLWGWRDGHWWTPPVEAGILPGVMRSHLIEWLTCQNQRVCEEPWSPELVRQLDAIAYTNCVVEVVPIHRVIQENSERVYDPLHPVLRNSQKLKAPCF